MSNLPQTWIRTLGEPFLPGSGRKDPRDAFNEIRMTIPGRVDAEALATAPTFLLARQLYATRYFWEAHGLLDALSAAALRGERPHALLSGLALLADACVKIRQRQPNAAVRAVRDAEQTLAAAQGLEVALDLDAIIGQCAAFRGAILTGNIGDALVERPSLDIWLGQQDSAH